MPEFPLEGRVEEKQEGQGRGHCRHVAGSENGRTVFNRTGADRPEHSVARQGDWILSWRQWEINTLIDMFYILNNQSSNRKVDLKRRKKIGGEREREGGREEQGEKRKIRGGKEQHRVVGVKSIRVQEIFGRQLLMTDWLMWWMDMGWLGKQSIWNDIWFMAKGTT